MEPIRSRNEFMSSLRHRLNELREGRSFAEVADGFPASTESVRRWLTGVGSVPVDFVAHLSLKYNANANWIIWGSMPRQGVMIADLIQSSLRENQTLDRVSEAIAATLLGNSHDRGGRAIPMSESHHDTSTTSSPAIPLPRLA